jgi:hypothetical protein
VLQQVDSLMQCRPDSALNLLIGIADTLQEDKLTRPDYHEYQILIAEALYKNNFSQSNDSAVAQAAVFYDSVAELMPDNLALQYQRAKAHYYKAVGDTEKDEFVEACENYLKALEIMEGKFDDDKSDAKTMRLSALIYTRLGSLSYFEDAMSQSYSCYSSAYRIFHAIGDTVSETGVLISLGSIHSQNDNSDSAYLCYQHILNLSRDTNSLVYRDAQKGIAVILFEKGENDSAFMLMRKIISLSSDDEKQAYQYVLGKMFYNEKQFDSAVPYLEAAYLRENSFTKTSAAKLLSQLYSQKSDLSKENFYNRQYLQHGSSELSNVSRKTEIVNLFRDFELERYKAKSVARDKVWVYWIVLSVLAGLILVIGGRAFYFNRQKANLKGQIDILNATIQQLEEANKDLEENIQINQYKMDQNNSDMNLFRET